jgi:hypothetical protein
MRVQQLLIGPALAALALVCAVPLSHAHAQVPGGGNMAPSVTHNPQANTKGGAAMTAPSGESPRARSARCNRVANARHLTGSARQEFRLSCLATAAPATHAGTQTKKPTPTHAKDNLGVATPAQPH